MKTRPTLREIVTGTLGTAALTLVLSACQPTKLLVKNQGIDFGEFPTLNVEEPSLNNKPNTPVEKVLVAGNLHENAMGFYLRSGLLSDYFPRPEGFNKDMLSISFIDENGHNKGYITIMYINNDWNAENGHNGDYYNVINTLRLNKEQVIKVSHKFTEMMNTAQPVKAPNGAISYQVSSNFIQ